MSRQKNENSRTSKCTVKREESQTVKPRFDSNMVG